MLRGAMLNASKSAGYKVLAKKAKLRECTTYDNPLSEVVVDFRSRLFMYLRITYVNMPLASKIDGLFRAMNNLEEEKKHVVRAALAIARAEVSFMRVRKATYVFGSATPCPYKERTRLERDAAASARLGDFEDVARQFRSNMLDVELLSRCIAALESYMMSDLEGLCSVYRGKEWLLVPEAGYRIARKDDMFESDRTCARLGKHSAVLSEDMDCLALFGAELMVREVHRGYFCYTTLKDVMKEFKSVSRRNLAEKCCLMGTDYNLGLKGVGPVKVLKIDTSKTSRLCKSCLSAQSIEHRDFFEFLLTP